MNPKVTFLGGPFQRCLARVLRPMLLNFPATFGENQSSLFHGMH